MAGVGDRETWSTGWRGPPDGDHPPKNPPLGGNTQDPREVGRQRNGFSGGRRTKGHSSLATMLVENRTS